MKSYFNSQKQASHVLMVTAEAQPAAGAAAAAEATFHGL
jgi:hypothetical protein